MPIWNASNMNFCFECINQLNGVDGFASEVGNKTEYNGFIARIRLGSVLRLIIGINKGIKLGFSNGKVVGKKLGAMVGFPLEIFVRS